MDSKAKLRGVDRISELPDAIVCHILSFLPTIYAVWTSLVSRRWANLWKSLPNLDFDNQDFPTKLTDRFVRVVDRLLYFRGSADIRKLRLHIKQCENLSPRDFCRVRRCILSAIRHNIVELDLLLLFQNQQRYGWEMPQSIFMCKTLEVLTVYSDLISYPPPTTGCFPSLKVLHVSMFRLDDGSLDKLFSYCPVLEDLTLDGTFPYCQSSNINISAPELKTLKIWLDYSIANGGYRLNKFCIAAPKLENLELPNYVSSYYYLESTTSLRRARIQFKDCECDRRYGFRYQDDHHLGFATRATALLAEICNVKYLYLENHARSHCLEACYLPAALDNLIHLELFFSDCYNWKLVTELLKRSPKLEDLVLEHRHHDYIAKYSKTRADRWNPPEFVPICMVSHLKTVTLKGYKGRRDEMEVAKYMLINGEVLNTITISTKDYIHEDRLYEKEEELYLRLLQVKKGSKTCQVKFV